MTCPKNPKFFPFPLLFKNPHTSFNNLPPTSLSPPPPPPKLKPKKEPHPMASAKQIEANRRNASGPHKMTEEGKATLRTNALRHGLAAQSHVLLPGEDANLFNQLKEDLQTEYAPSTTQQELLVDQIAESYWR